MSQCVVSHQHLSPTNECELSSLILHFLSFEAEDSANFHEVSLVFLECSDTRNALIVGSSCVDDAGSNGRRRRGSGSTDESLGFSDSDGKT